MSTPAAVQLRAAVSLIEQFPALAGVDVDVDAGEVVLVQGPNGAGKSTLLRLCAGLAPLNSGQGLIFGHDLGAKAGRRAIRQAAGLLAHHTFLYEELTVIENLRFWGRANRAELGDLDAVVERVGIDRRLLDVRVGNLSAGQRRRTSLAALVSRRPRLWLLDEPHGGLDPSGRDMVDELIGQASAAGATVLLASHDLERAEAVATRTLTVRGGLVTGALATDGSNQATTQRSDQPPLGSQPAGAETQPRSGVGDAG